MWRRFAASNSNRPDSVGPKTAQQLPPIDLGFRRTFKSPLETGGYFASLLGHGRSLIDGDLPIAHLFLDAWHVIADLGRVDHLTDAAPALRNGRCAAIILVACRIVRFRARILRRFTLVIGLWLRFDWRRLYICSALIPRKHGSTSTLSGRLRPASSSNGLIDESQASFQRLGSRLARLV